MKDQLAEMVHKFSSEQQEDAKKQTIVSDAAQSKYLSKNLGC